MFYDLLRSDPGPEPDPDPENLTGSGSDEKVWIRIRNKAEGSIIFTPPLPPPLSTPYRYVFNTVSIISDTLALLINC